MLKLVVLEPSVKKSATQFFVSCFTFFKEEAEYRKENNMTGPILKPLGILVKENGQMQDVYVQRGLDGETNYLRLFIDNERNKTVTVSFDARNNKIDYTNFQLDTKAFFTMAEVLKQYKKDLTTLQ